MVFMLSDAIHENMIKNERGYTFSVIQLNFGSVFFVYGWVKIYKTRSARKGSRPRTGLGKGGNSVKQTPIPPVAQKVYVRSISIYIYIYVYSCPMAPMRNEKGILSYVFKLA